MPLLYYTINTIHEMRTRCNRESRTGERNWSMRPSSALRPRLQRFVHGARSIALEVQGHVGVARFLDSSNHLFPQAVDHPAELLGPELQPRDIAVVAHPQRPEPQIPEGLLGRADDGQVLPS